MPPVIRIGYPLIPLDQVVRSEFGVKEEVNEQVGVAGGKVDLLHGLWRRG